MFNIFETATDQPLPMSAGRRVQPSPAERLFRDLETHRDSQAAILAETSRAAGWAATPLAEFLLGMVGDSETRDLEMLDRMTTSLRDALEWTYSAGALPEASIGTERSETIKSIKQLLRLERQRAQTTRRLAKAYAGIDGGLQQALLEVSAAAAESNSLLLQLMLRRFKADSKRTTLVSATQDGRGQEQRQRLAA